MTREEEIKQQSKKRHFEKYNCDGFCPDFEAGAVWADKHSRNNNLLDNAIDWFNDIAEMCGRLTSENVSHQAVSIKGKALRAAEYLKKHKQ